MCCIKNQTNNFSEKNIGATFKPWDSERRVFSFQILGIQNFLISKKTNKTTDNVKLIFIKKTHLEKSST